MRPRNRRHALPHPATPFSPPETDDVPHRATRFRRLRRRLLRLIVEEEQRRAVSRRGGLDAGGRLG